MPQMYYRPMSPMALGSQSPIDFGDCPCGEPAVAGQLWITEWFNNMGLIDKCVVLRLCGTHKARMRGED